jgi:hypothetical protein
MNNHLKRLASLTCAFAFAGTTCLSILPTASASEASTAPESSSTSIFVATDRHDFDGNNLVAVLEQVVADTDAVQPTVTLLGGDSVGKGSDFADTGHPAYTVAEPNAEIYSVLGDDVATYYTFGSHDTGNTNGYEEYLSGPAECNGYYIYGVSYAQMLYATDEQAEAAGYSYIDLDDDNGISASAASANFLNWVNSLDDNMPIIVMSHVPMHANRKDNLGATIWCEALNKAAETHDVVMLFGHNHTSENLNDTDRYYYLVPAGGSMPVQGPDKSGDYSEPVTINFTYMNAGYLTLGYGSLLTFTDVDTDGMYDELTVQRYSTTGKDDTFGNTDIASPYTINLTQWAEKSDDANDAEQPSETTPDADAEQSGGTTPDADVEQPSETTPDADVEQPSETTPDADAEQSGETTPDADVEQPSETIPDADAEQPSETTPDADAEQPSGTTSDADAEQPSGTTSNANTEQPSGTTSDADAEQPSGTTSNANTEQSGKLTPAADTQQAGKNTQVTAVKTGDSGYAIYFFTLAASAYALLALVVKKHHP